jgi:hypothetical protein
LRKLIPLATSAKNPPYSIESFFNFSRWATIFKNVRFFLIVLKLIFFRLSASDSGIAEAIACISCAFYYAEMLPRLSP